MRPSRRRILFLTILLIGLAWVAIRFFGPHRGDSDVEHAGGPMASVRVVPLRKGVMTEEISAYGTVVPIPGAARSITTAYECRVRRVAAASGQRVSGGQPLLEIEPSPDALVKYRAQESLFETTRSSLASVRRRFDLHLATNEELAQATQVSREAELTLKGLRTQGMSPAGRVIHSPFAGLVGKLDVQEGAIVPGGGTLVEVVPDDGVEVRVGVESGDVGHLRIGRPVILSSVIRPASTSGRIRVISSALDPSTRLVDVLVSFPPSKEFLLGEPVRGRIEVASGEVLIAPRAALLPEAGHHVLFTIEKGRARRHVVRTGLENEKEIEILGDGPGPGAPVVVLGNYELRDGMAVKSERAP